MQANYTIWAFSWLRAHRIINRRDLFFVSVMIGDFVAFGAARDLSWGQEMCRRFSLSCLRVSRADAR